MRTSWLGVLLGTFLAAVVIAAGPSARADFLVYSLPTTDGNLGVVIQGTSKVQTGRIVTFRHAKFGNLVFSMDEVSIHKVPTLGQQLAKRVNQAKGNADATFKAAVWALQHGMLKEYYETVASVLRIDPNHAEALRIKELKRKIDVPLPDDQNSRLEQELRTFCPKQDMKVLTSKHFIMLHDTPDKKPGDAAKGKKMARSRAEERLRLLEQVYESFLLTFFSRGVPLEMPPERLKIVLFNQYNDFKTFSVAQDASLIHAAGYYNPIINISVFYDHASNKELQELKKLGEKLTKEARELRGKFITRDLKRLGEAVVILAKIEQEANDIEVVSHEATHHLAGNTGLFPRHILVPRWVHEGLAAYFESPSDVAWSGIGAVNERRLQYYRALEPDREHSNIDFIVGDLIFKLAANVNSEIHGYGQAWALTHFLMAKHFDKFIAFYRKLGEMPPDSILTPEILTEVFSSVFGKERAALDVEWRSYMADLKTDTQRVLDGDELDDE